MPKAKQHKRRRINKIKPLIKTSVHRIKVRHLIVIVLLLGGLMTVSDHSYQVQANSCPDVKIIFARGSGGERYTSSHYLAFKSSLESKLTTTDLTYEFEDLDYPAVSIDVGDGHLGTLLGAYIGSGEAYEFGESVHQGTAELLRTVNNDGCSNTKYVFGGYSQGAVVLLNGITQIDPSKVVYIATFGDPKIYLPEGAGPVPTACSGRGLSDYRIYVPDCRAHEGILGARNPYVIDGYTGKIGTWCNKYDILCSSYYSIKSHTSYVEDGLYEDASKLLFSKIAKVFEIKNEYTSPHDTAILIDSTGSMDSLIDQYKAEALNLAQKTLDAGGRVALYDYRDLADDYTPIERCNFETCTIDTFQSGLEAIQTDNGGDAAESLLSASVHVMQHLEWRLGSTKSLVILTDDGYHSPDLDGTTFYDVKRISQQIDPVNFYIITTDDNMELYQPLAEATGGSVTSNMSNLSILTDTIMEKYDSLPRVEEEFADVTDDTSLSHLTISQIEENDGSIKINFDTDGIATIVILNDAILGATDQHDITFTDLNNNVINTVTLVPLSNTRRGEPVSVNLNISSGYGSVDAPTSSNLSNSSTSPSLPNFPQNFTIPKAPNTGRK